MIEKVLTNYTPMMGWVITGGSMLVCIGIGLIWNKLKK